VNKWTAVLAIVAISIIYIAMANAIIKLIVSAVHFILGG